MLSNQERSALAGLHDRVQGDPRSERANEWTSPCSGARYIFSGPFFSSSLEYLAMETCGDGTAGLRPGHDRSPAPALLTVGHGALGSAELAELLASAGVQLVVDIRSAPGSRRHPHFGRDQMEQWLPAAEIDYRWEKDLGGHRRPVAGSANTALRHPGFRGYADYMATGSFTAGLARLLDDAAARPTAAMCAETLWWRCHRRLVADAAVLLEGAAVYHLGHDGRLSAHQATEGARMLEKDGTTRLVYDDAAAACHGLA